MDTTHLDNVDDFKLDFEIEKPLCRCCLTTDRKMFNAEIFDAYFQDLAGICVSNSDGLPLWLCFECSALLRKAVKFKHKVIRAHTLLYEYVTRCAPFPIDAQDPELTKYASPYLVSTPTMILETNGKGKIGYHNVLEHEKLVSKTELEGELPPLRLNSTDLDQEPVKQETGLSDYEDNLTLDEFRINKITDEDISNFLDGAEQRQEPLLEEKEAKKKTKKKKREDKAKKKKQGDATNTEVKTEKKTTIRKAVEIDPSKIRIVALNPEEQIKQREEESKTNLKFPFQCNLCFKGFNFEAKLQNHMHKHSPSRGPFECKLCHMFLPTSYSFSVHSLIHTRRYECVKCGRRMTDRASILDHYRSQHEGIMTLYTCQFCGKVFKVSDKNNSKTHRGHVRNHHSGERPKCDQCGKTFINADSLAEHQQIHQGIKNYSCGECDKQFRTRTQMKHHQLKHSTSKDYYCVECDTRFKSSHSLRQHLQKSLKHKDIESLKWGCARCLKRFESARQLAAHTRVQHEGVRAHPCGLCGAALASRASLHKHLAAVHAGRRPPPRHVCDACGKAFRGRSVLANHVRTHTGEKPFQCELCARKFTQRTAMRTHVKLVHLKQRRAAAPPPPPPPPPPPEQWALYQPPLD
ncbi:zinc finger protein 480 [Manduca sexta]|uniref:zinc finger protein 480 n=1 Tax=Manduca sexta TaxID=7130 RepID=UPI0018901211|nr:zinc finger protein 480 [Manduca sexta]